MVRSSSLLAVMLHLLTALAATIGTSIVLWPSSDWSARMRTIEILKENDSKELDRFIERGDHLRPVTTTGLQAMRYGWCYPIHIAGEIANKEALRLFLDSGVDVDTRDNEGVPVIEHIIRSGRVDLDDKKRACIVVLIEHGIALESNYPIRSKQALGTILHRTASMGFPLTVEFLLELGADVNAIDSTGNSALHHAVDAYSYLHADESQFRLIKALVDAGAVRDIKNTSGKTPLDLCKTLIDEQSREKCIELFDGE